MSEVKEKLEVVNDVDPIRAELEEVKSERDQYKAAYEQLIEQNSNVWGMYSNLIDYVTTQTTRKKAN